MWVGGGRGKRGARLKRSTTDRSLLQLRWALLGLWYSRRIGSVGCLMCRAYLRQASAPGRLGPLASTFSFVEFRGLVGDIGQSLLATVLTVIVRMIVDLVRGLRRGLQRQPRHDALGGHLVCVVYGRWRGPSVESSTLRCKR